MEQRHSPLVYAAFTFGTTAAICALTLHSGTISLFVQSVPSVAGLKSTFGLVSDHRAPLTADGFLTIPDRTERSEVATRSLPQGTSEETQGARKLGVFALGAFAASALAFLHLFRQPHDSSTALGTALLNPPLAETGKGTYNKGIVTPEEAMNLPFTMAQLKDAIPSECFEKSLGWSLFYFARDWAIVGLMYYFQPTFFGLGILGKVLWWNIVGFYGWCLFVVGHDCGHGSFSEYGWLNQLLGHVCHAPLLVPFNGWRISHWHHHQFHNDCERDHSWRPGMAKNLDNLSPALRWVRFSPLILLVFPYYLLSSSQEDGFSGNHFWPWNPLFKKEDRWGIFWSAISVVGWAGALAAATMQFGFSTVFQLYWVPYMIFVCWLDLVTLMQHTDKNALFFKGNTWNYLRGALSTVDRTYRHLIDPFNLGYGRVIDHLHHHISDGHVVHHIFFTRIPHYRLMAATEAIKPILGKHYRYDDTPILQAFMTTLQDCWFVDDVKNGVVQYKGEDAYRKHQALQQMQGMA